MDVLERNYEFYFNIYEPCSPSETSAAMFVCTQTFCGIRKRFTNGTVNFFSVFCRCGMSSTICRKIITENSIQMVSASCFVQFTCSRRSGQNIYAAEKLLGEKNSGTIAGQQYIRCHWSCPSLQRRLILGVRTC